MAFCYASRSIPEIPTDFRQIAESVLGPVDWQDEHPRFYRRRAIACEVEGVFLSAWAYFLQGDYGRLAQLEPVREYSPLIQSNIA